MQQRWIVWGIEINALHLPQSGKPVGVNQVVPIEGRGNAGRLQLGQLFNRCSRPAQPRRGRR